MNKDRQQEWKAQRFAQLLASYGADSGRWPEAERSDALAFLDNDVNAGAMLQEARQLDQWLQSSELPAFAALETRLLQQALPARRRGGIDRLAAWLLPSPGHVLHQLWRPAVAACLPLVIGLLVGFQVELVPEAQAMTVEEELYLISLSDYAEIL
ncbi:MAG: hypothetical protein WD071_04225 [Pseudohongiella sp.]|uniref:hypothetical protein n=1 Tax=Pseudohongiella sp. TaxID=1979412 RepID=UPI00349FF28B